ncbi:MAG TPA: hypothetical protein PKK74_01150 [Candidatus Methanoculleus thermohydrogenotrophicum]|jgi:hypothetical protein|nr:hypothetical protein [Candidatus Methanoculleus thermohydrogenotrophicum]NLM82017.1 hypothetical protein [Candidatus Methanoculleus thermohydrogenotrophicum]HOB17292.1 hypothetical protein [Candidatus Methanoculleus thermohydrogenotrophicum]HPZ37423.1 hypothetical protein [Candidatus Methanoculleus thermohydrogenotrophicum]HQC90900.1 hypothetical protein [Candidatus Methanoculleus thermohydrogenotrophicum]
MKTRSLTALIILLLAFAFCAACIGSEDGGGPPSTETPEATTTPVTTTTPASLKPGPTETPPPGKEVEFQIAPGYPSRNDLTITFRGGKGQNLLKNINVRVTKSTGEVIEETLKPIVGSDGEVTITDAKGENRVEIIVSYVTGGTYKVKDEIVKVT